MRYETLAEDVVDMNSEKRRLLDSHLKDAYQKSLEMRAHLIFLSKYSSDAKTAIRYHNKTDDIIKSIGREYEIL